MAAEPTPHALRVTAEHPALELLADTLRVTSGPASPEDIAKLLGHALNATGYTLVAAGETVPRSSAEQLAGGVRSFLSSLPFQPPEAIGFQARVKLAGPLAEYERQLEEAGDGR